jgi:imidazole glycerol phosphate synthase glutamine amidotransferase subunit
VTEARGAEAGGGEAEVLVVRTGVANLASVLAGLRRAGAEPRVSDDAAAVRAARAVVLPGVGAFAAGVAGLAERGLDVAIAERVREGRALLSVCLGLQLLLEGSEEGPGVAGLSVVPGVARRFHEAQGVRVPRGGLRVPQLGWNRVVPDAGCALLREGYAYFANSYRLVEPPPGFSCATAHHGGPFVAAFERGAVLACQFHPELSGRWGIDLLRRWLGAAHGWDTASVHAAGEGAGSPEEAAC